MLTDEFCFIGTPSHYSQYIVPFQSVLLPLLPISVDTLLHTDLWEHSDGSVQVLHQQHILSISFSTPVIVKKVNLPPHCLMYCLKVNQIVCLV